MEKRGWDEVDFVLVTGDAYIDSPHIGIAVIGHVLQNAGYNTAVIAQPDVNSPADITRLGEPKLFWGVSAGSVDSMVANYTASKKPRKSDDYTPGGINNRRPDRACMVYTNLIRRNFKNTKPIMLGGIEASLRRVAHYDFWKGHQKNGKCYEARELIIALPKACRTKIRICCFSSSQSPFVSNTALNAQRICITTRQ